MSMQAHNSSEGFQVYNGLDACVTFEVLEQMRRLYPGAHSGPIYSFERALQAPALDMMRRGWLVDAEVRTSLSKELRARIARCETLLQRLALAVWDRPLNPNSPKQLKEFFYGHMRLPEQKSFQKGVVKMSMDIDTLEKLALYIHARPVISIILLVRDLQKQLQVVDTKLGKGGRFYHTIKITGTVTGRFATAESNEDGGRNIQNIDEDLRRMFIADPGKKLFGCDLEQSDSRWVGWMCGVLFNDWTYHYACCSGDLHTQVCKMIWPRLAWSGEKRADRALADQDFARGNSRRQLAKKAGHGTNFLGKAAEIARQLGVPESLIAEFQVLYLKAFPAIGRLHEWVLLSLRETSSVTNPFGRTRHFFDRKPYADSLRTGKVDKVLRDAVAQLAQSATSDHEKLGLWRVWRHLPQVELLAEVHDAIYGNFPPNLEASILPQIQSLMRIELHHGPHTLDIPSEIKSGWNWQSFSDEADVKAGRAKHINLFGLKKFSPSHPDTREPPHAFNLNF